MSWGSKLTENEFCNEGNIQLAEKELEKWRIPTRNENNEYKKENTSRGESSSARFDRARVKGENRVNLFRISEPCRGLTAGIRS